jgi:hypothetical protein
MNIHCPLNSVSFGQVSLNILKELFKRGMEVNLFPNGKWDLSSYNITPEFGQFLVDSAENARDKFDRYLPGLKVWHISGLMDTYSERRYALTFHETDRLTPTEINILNSLDVVFVTSTYTKSVFESAGLSCEVVYMPLGFDSDHFSRMDEPAYDDGRIVFGLFGKLETRKSTLRVLKAWADKYGNNKKYMLHAAVTNPFIDVDIQRQMIGQVLGKNFFNINFLPFVVKNDQYNQNLNSIDIDLTGMSRCEGFNLPAFQTLCLGKQGIFLDAHVHQDYAKDGGGIMVPTSGNMEVHDGIFFKKGEKFNQGFWPDFKDEDLIGAMEQAESVAKVRNTLGEGLKEKFNYEKTADILLSNV